MSKKIDLDAKRRELEDKYNEILRKIQELEQVKQKLIAEAFKIEGAINTLKEISSDD